MRWKGVHRRRGWATVGSNKAGRVWAAGAVSAPRWSREGLRDTREQETRELRPGEGVVEMWVQGT
jgi:hypothetical protein